MAVIHSEEENEMIRTILCQNNWKEAWIGFSDKNEEGNFVWDDGSTVDYTNFRDGEPNNYGGTEDCTFIKEGGGWNDVKCGENAAFVC